MEKTKSLDYYYWVQRKNGRTRGNFSGSCRMAISLLQYPPYRWAFIYSGGIRYGRLSSNTDEFHHWIIEARELPIIQVVEQIHVKLMTEFEERRMRFKSWFFALSSSAEKLMIGAMNLASTYQVLQSDEVEFEILLIERSDIVNTKLDINEFEKRKFENSTQKDLLKNSEFSNFLFSHLKFENSTQKERISEMGNVPLMFVIAIEN
ncbi:hypothetical protein OROGR_009734 [Orobanche gracilis]